MSAATAGEAVEALSEELETFEARNGTSVSTNPQQWELGADLPAPDSLGAQACVSVGGVALSGLRVHVGSSLRQAQFVCLYGLAVLVEGH